MSRVGKKPVAIPKGCTAKVEGQRVSVKGAKGELYFVCPEDVTVSFENDNVSVVPRNDTKRAQAMWGMSRAMVNNLVVGVSTGFTRKLDITGVGYKAAVQGKVLQLSLGYSHDVPFAIPDGITIATPRPDRDPDLGDRQSVRSARSPPRSGPCAHRSRTRARVSAIRTSSSSARKARRSKARWHRIHPRVASSASAKPSARVPMASRGSLSSARRSRFYCQIIDDAAGRTLASASSMEKDQREGLKTGANIEAAAAIGKLIAERAKAAGVTTVVFDRGGYMYHGRVKALAEGAREGGLAF